MTKKELIEMLSVIPDDAKIQLTKERTDLFSNYCTPTDIKGFYENNGCYILSSLNVRPYKVEKYD